MMFMEFMIGFLLIMGIGGTSMALDTPKSKVAHGIFLAIVVTFYSISMGRFILEGLK